MRILLTLWVHSVKVKALGWALAYFVWEGTALALLLAFLLFVLRPASARARYATASLILLAMPVAFGLTLAMLLPGHDLPATSAALMPRLGHSLTLATTPRISAMRPSIREQLPLLIAVWMFGVLYFYARGVAGWIGVWRMRRRGVCSVAAQWQDHVDRLCRRMKVSRPVRLLESCFTATPVLVGWLRPMILLPVGCLAGLPVEQIECVLLHELAHVRRHDYLVNLLQTVVEGLLFYHPAVWWVSRQVRTERENCCDDLVVEFSGNARVYAATLAALEVRRAPRPALAATEGNLMKRIHRVLQPPAAPHTSPAPAIAAALLLATAGLALAAWPTKTPQQKAIPAVAMKARQLQRSVQAILLQSQSALEQRQDATKPARNTEDLAAQERAILVANYQAAQQDQMATPYRKWLNEDVAYIISNEERAAFRRLQTDEEREQFIEQFWARRDPTPGTVENEFKEEHYRRIAYANEHFSTPAGLPGWKTDRGRIYISYGPPNEIEDHSAGGSYQRPAEQGGGTTSTYPFQQWRYTYIEGIGNNVIIEFVDRNMNGEFHMTMDPSEKDALLNVPNAGKQILQQMGVVGPVPAGAKVFRSQQDSRVTISAEKLDGGDWRITVQAALDQSSGPYEISTGFTTADRGRPVSMSASSVRQPLYSKVMGLPRGSFKGTVLVKDTATGVTKESTFEFTLD